MATTKTAKQPIFTLTNVAGAALVVGGVTWFFLRTRPAAALPSRAGTTPAPELVVANTSRATGDARVGDVLQISVTPQAPYTLFARHPDGNEAQVTCPPNAACAVTVDAQGTWTLRATTPDGAPLGLPATVSVVPRLSLVQPKAGVQGGTPSVALAGTPGGPSAPATKNAVPVAKPPPSSTRAELTSVRQEITSLSSEGQQAFLVGTAVLVRRAAMGGVRPLFQTVVTQNGLVSRSEWDATSDYRFVPRAEGTVTVQTFAADGSAQVSSTPQALTVYA